jgi:hypothetical protein
MSKIIFSNTFIQVISNNLQVFTWKFHLGEEVLCPGVGQSANEPHDSDLVPDMGF